MKVLWIPKRSPGKSQAPCRIDPFDSLYYLACERGRVEPGGGKIGHLGWVKARDRPPESKECAVDFALVNLVAEHRNVVLCEFRFDAL
jgi:hypothetical protein